MLEQVLDKVSCLNWMPVLPDEHDRLIEQWKHHPEIIDRPIYQPIFVTGLPRSGTTLLHNLLAQDPAIRVPLAWEVMLPVPAPERAGYETDARIARVERMLRWFSRLAPEFKTIHPLGARLPQECVALTSYAFRSSQFHITYHVPTYQVWLLHQTQGDYTFHRTFLQYLQWRCPAQRWALKAPAHLFELDALRKTYPDAYIVHMGASGQAPRFSADDYSVVGSVGAGLEYFLAYNMTVGVDAKYLFQNPEAKIDEVETEIDLNSVLVSIGMRIFFP
jgi:hypothetical protein